MPELISIQHAHTQPSALAASRILKAIETSDLAGLESDLDLAQWLASSPTPASASEDEQLELLGAVAGQLRQSIDRFGRALVPSLEGVEVHLRLLRHLAREPAPLS